MPRQTPQTISVISVLLLTSVFATAAAASDFVVTRFDDPTPNGCFLGECSLREAVIAANSNGLADRIFLDAGFYSLTRAGIDEDAADTGDLDITDDLEIIGMSGKELLTLVDATGQDRVFEIVGSDTEVTLRKFLVTGGLLDGPGFAVSISEATATLEDMEVTSNTGIGGVSAVRVADGGDATVSRTTIASNSGVGLSASGASSLVVVNSTVAYNEGLVGWQVVAVGSEIWLTHVTISGESFADVNSLDGGVVTFANTVVDGECNANMTGTLTSLGGNYEATGNTCEFNLASDVNGAFTAGLEPLGDWGGPTSTRRPVPESPQIDNGLPEHCLPTDQRGAPRPADGNADGEAGCDRGSVEYGSIFYDGFESGDTTAW